MIRGDGLFGGADRISLRSGAEKRILQGCHDWIFSNEIERFPEDKNAALVDVYSRGGRWQASALYNSSSLISGRILSRRQEPIDREFWRSRLQAAWDRRLSWYPGEECFRWVFGESDGLPGLIIDRYGNYAVMEVVSMALEKLLPELKPILAEVFPFEGILLRQDNALRSRDGLTLGGPVVFLGNVPTEPLEVEIDGLRCFIDCWKGQKTGYFLDQRDNRRRLQELSSGRRILDLYCHSGAFGLHLTRWGAQSAVLVDSSPLAIDLCQRQAAANGIGAKIRAVKSDVDRFLLEDSEIYDLAIVDPPNWAPRKKDAPVAIRKFRKILASSMSKVAPKGFLAAATCSHHIGLDDFLGACSAAAASQRSRWRLLETRYQSKDHPVLLAMPETLYLKFVILERLNES
ncbi:MAG: class I SAM-dependent rRNA methyltransferase [Elusimicrobia bacterium]|nr:class I SAM-dependent rRNA methyltransferase [Elusimicrobiota bacterium]